MASSRSPAEAFVRSVAKSECMPGPKNGSRRTLRQVFDGSLEGDLARMRIARDLKRMYPDLQIFTREALLRRILGP